MELAMQYQIEKQMEREEADLAKDLADGFISEADYNKRMREMQREYAEAAKEAAQEAYEHELHQW